VTLLQETCQKEYDEALPSLKQAMEAVKQIDKTQLQIMKSFTNPPPLVQTTMEAVCLIFGFAESWEAGKRYLLNDIQFLNKLLSFDSRKVNP